MSRALGTSSSSTASSEGTACHTGTPAAVSALARSGPALASASDPARASAPTNQADHMVSTDMSKEKLNPP